MVNSRRVFVQFFKSRIQSSLLIPSVSMGDLPSYASVKTPIIHSFYTLHFFLLWGGNEKIWISVKEPFTTWNKTQKLTIRLLLTLMLKRDWKQLDRCTNYWGKRFFPYLYRILNGNCILRSSGVYVKYNYEVRIIISHQYHQLARIPSLQMDQVLNPCIGIWNYPLNILYSIIGRVINRW